MTRAFVHAGWHVAVVDGLLPRTSANPSLLADVVDRVDVTHSRIEDLEDLGDRLAAVDVVVDSMGWTRHHEGMADPLYDMALNLGSHLRLLSALQASAPYLLYLGSRSQFGRVSDRVEEDTPQRPCDVQGIHKAAAETHFRLRAEAHRYSVTSLRLPNCFGPGQPVAGEDSGLIGGFIRDLMADRIVEIYGTHRARHIAYAVDVAAVAERLCRQRAEGFVAYNYAGQRVAMLSLVERLCDLIGKGSFVEAPMPAAIGAMDVGDALIVDDALRRELVDLPETDLDHAFAETIDYFRRDG